MGKHQGSPQLISIMLGLMTKENLVQLQGLLEEVCNEQETFKRKGQFELNALEYSTFISA